MAEPGASQKAVRLDPADAAGQSGLDHRLAEAFSGRSS